MLVRLFAKRAETIIADIRNARAVADYTAAAPLSKHVVRTLNEAEPEMHSACVISLREI